MCVTPFPTEEKMRDGGKARRVILLVVSVPNIHLIAFYTIKNKPGSLQTPKRLKNQHLLPTPSLSFYGFRELSLLCGFQSLHSSGSKSSSAEFLSGNSVVFWVSLHARCCHSWGTQLWTKDTLRVWDDFILIEASDWTNSYFHFMSRSIPFSFWSKWNTTWQQFEMHYLHCCA